MNLNKSVFSRMIKRAMSPGPWDLSNEVLYRFCREYPDHNREDEIIAKVLLIGRTYAAAIERRRKVDRNASGDAFYTHVVVPEIRRANIDRWLRPLQRKTLDGDNTEQLLLVVHGRLTALFRRITGLEKRSLASKYLHFHFPELFFIYDSRALSGLRVVKTKRLDVVMPSVGDTEYGKFVRACSALRQQIKSEHGAVLSPRQLDKLLLELAALAES